MNLTFKSLEIVNFGSWTHGLLPLDNQGLVLIKGPTGSGKSTIAFKALYWVITGELPEGSQADEVINESIKKNTAVKLKWEFDKNKYELARYRKHVQWKNKVVLLKNNKRFGDKDSKIKTINRIVFDLLGLDKDTLLKVLLFMQRDSKRFPALTDSAQKQYIETISALYILPYAEQISKKRLQKSKELVDKFLERKARYQEMIDTTLDNIKQEQKNLKKQNDTIETIINRLINKKEIHTATKAALEIDITNTEPLLKKLQDTVAEIKTKIEIHAVDLKRLKKINKQQDKLSNECIMCGSSLTIEQIELAKRNVRSQAIQTRIKIQELEKENTVNKNELKSLELNIEIMARGLNQSVRKINKLESKIESKTKVAEESSAIEILKDTLRKARKRLSKTEKMLSMVVPYIPRLNRLSLIFGKKGLRASLLPALLNNDNAKNPGLQQRTNLYLSVFHLAPQVSYSLEEGRIIQRYNSITNPDLRRSYGSLSGGEKQMVDISTGLALRDLAEASRAKSYELVILDEPLEGLDSSLIQTVPSLLEAIKKKSVFVISHSEALVPHFSKVLEIRQQKGISSFVRTK